MNKIVLFGDSQIFIRRDENGAASRGFKATVNLSQALGEVVVIQDKAIITATGYNKLNQLATVNILTPPLCTVDGVGQSNPHVERHPQTKVIQTVNVRKVAFGFSPTGNMVAIDKTLFFNIYTYLLQDLQAKIKKYPACGCLGVKDSRPDSISHQSQVWKTTPQGKKYCEPGNVQEIDVKKKPMAFYPIEEPVGIWVDISHPEIMAAFDSHVQRQKFGDRIAQTIVERNCLKSHPAIAVTNVLLAGPDKGGVATVEVYGWQHNMNVRSLNDMADKISKGEVTEKDIEIVASKEEATFEETEMVEAEEIIDNTMPIHIDIPTMSVNVAITDDVAPEKSKIENDIQHGIFLIGEEKATAILQKTFRVSSVEDLPDVNKPKYLNLLHAEVDKRSGKDV